MKRAFSYSREYLGHWVSAVFKIIIIDKFHKVNPKGSKLVSKKRIDKIDIEQDVDQVKKINYKHLYRPSIMCIFTVQKIFGKSGKDDGFSAIPTFDGGFIFTGRSNSLVNDDENFELIRHDITFPLYLEVDEIYNLACPASPPAYQRKPIETMKTSVQGAINMLELAYKYGAKILQASTSEIYGEPLNHPQQEEDWGNVNPIGPRSCYDEGKRVGETLCYFYKIKQKVDILVKIGHHNLHINTVTHLKKNLIAVLVIITIVAIRTDQVQFGATRQTSRVSVRRILLRLTMSF